MSVVDTVKGAIPTVKLPEIKLPEIKLPELKVPTVEIPTAVEKPVYAVVGAGDLAVERATAQVEKAQAQAKAAPGLPAQVQAKLTELSTKAQAQAKALPELLKALPASVKATLDTKVSKPLAVRQDKAEAFYGTLATRGEKVVTGLTKKPATKPAVKPAAKKAPAKKAPAKKTAAKR
jgi:hypothetical protein